MKKTLQLASDRDSLTKVELLVDELSDRYDLGAEVYANIMVVLVEAVSNAIIHGNRQDKSLYVELLCIVSDELINFRVKDYGNGFDYEAIPDPTSQENIEKPYGRGIFLIRHLADKVKFSDYGRVIDIVFNLK